MSALFEVMPIDAVVIASPKTVPTVNAPELRNRKLPPPELPANSVAMLFVAPPRLTDPAIEFARRLLPVIAAVCVILPLLDCNRTIPPATPAPAFRAESIATPPLAKPAPPTTVISLFVVVSPTTGSATESTTVPTLTAVASR